MRPRASSGFRAGRAGLALALALLALPAAARAETKAVTCATLQATIDALAAKADHGEGDTLVLGEMCGGAQLGGTGIAVPAHVGFTLQGLPGAGAGIDGTSISGPLLSAPEAGAIALEGLTFRNGRGGAAAVSLHAARARIVADSFLENSSSGSLGAGLSVDESSAGTCPGAAPRLLVRGSVFAGNTLTVAGPSGGGAGAFLRDDCAGAGDAIEGNVVEGNRLRSSGAQQVLGAGFELVAQAGEATRVVQRGNVFQGNRIDALAGEASYGGGGEWLEGMALASVGDRWSNNAIPGPSAAGPSRGAGLGVSACGSGPAAQSSLQDAVVAANQIVGGAGGAASGAGVFAGCTSGNPGGLSLLDSTVTVNSTAAAGTAGLAGSGPGALALANTIVLGDLGGVELAGFGGVSSSFSDVCTPGTLTPLPGERNVCTDPQLADQGNPASADVHETNASPTREAGSNSLVPAGLSSDYYGAARIAGGTLQPTCLEGLVPIAGPVVDIGAAESGAARALANGATLCPPRFRRSSFAFPSVSVRPGGALLLTFRGLARGTLIARATVLLPRTVVRTIGGRRRRVRRPVSVPYGTASRLGAMPPLLGLRITPRHGPASALHRRRRLTVSLTVTYAADRLFPATQTRAVAMRWIAPAHR